MLPCESIKLILLSVESLKPSLHQPSNLGHRRKDIPYESASVLHISNSAKYSFITEKLLLKLLRANYGSRSSSFKIDNDSIVHLQWHYPNLKHMETTSHLVVRDSHFQIILRKEDWERPIRHWLMKDYPEELLRERGILQPRPKQDSQSHEAESIKSEAECGGATQASDTGPGRDGYGQGEEHENRHGDGQQDAQDPEENEGSNSEIDDGGSSEDEDEDNEEIELKREHHDDSNDESQGANIEVVDTDSEDSEVDGETEEDAYWHWSPERRQWFHQNEDSSFMWFPRLV